MKKLAFLQCIRFFVLMVLLGDVFGLSLRAHGKSTSRELASRLFLRLAGRTLPLSDARRSQMESLINQGRLSEAAQIASSDPNFLESTVVNFATPLSNQTGAIRTSLTDFSALAVGLVRDGRDFRTFLYDDVLYIGDSKNPAFLSECNLANGSGSASASCTYSPAQATTQSHFTAMTNMGFSKYLIPIKQRPEPGFVAAGALTTYAWGRSMFSAGTNRRATAYALENFLCTSIHELADFSISDFRVRRDVARAPGNDTQVYQTECRGCHAGMDALSGAWAHLDYQDTLQSSSVRAKFNQNGQEFPEGYMTVDASWINLFSGNPKLGWRGEMSGTGPAAFGRMLANSGGFSACMAKRAFKKLCHRDPKPEEEGLINRMKNGFEASNYNLRKLLELAAIQPECLGE